MITTFENGACGDITEESSTISIPLKAIRVLRARGIFVPQSSLQMINYPPSTARSTLRGKALRVILDEICT